MSDVRPRDHLEVRCARTNELLGWLKHSSPDLIERWTAGYVVPVPPEVEDGDLDYVEEDFDGAKTVRVALVGEQLTIAVRWQRHEVDAFTDRQLLKGEGPSYAKHVYQTARDSNLYEWPSLAARTEEAEQLFDLDIFEPHDPSPTIPEIVALDEEAKWFDPRGASLLRPATSTLKGSFRPSYPGRTGSGFVA